MSPPREPTAPSRPGLDPVAERIELRHLEQVIEIVRSGGFSGAARRLQLTQPALSKSIARLESQLSAQCTRAREVPAHVLEALDTRKTFSL